MRCHVQSHTCSSAHTCRSAHTCFHITRGFPHTHASKQIETLKVGWCKIGGAEGAKAVADLLMFNTSLQRLDLRGNGLGNDGAVLVSRALREHTNEQLRELDLGYNEIKDDGACAIAQVLVTELASLIHVVVVHATRRGVPAMPHVSLLQALKNNPGGAPKELKVNSNYLTRFGQVALTEALDMVYEMGGGREIVITY